MYKVIFLQTIIQLVQNLLNLHLRIIIQIQYKYNISLHSLKLSIVFTKVYNMFANLSVNIHFMLLLLFFMRLKYTY